MNATTHAAHPDGHRLHRWMLYGSLGIGAFSALPYVLPVLGIGKAEAAEGLMHFIGAPVTQAYGSGLAATLQSGLASVPLIGGALTSAAPVSIFGITVAAGTIACLAASGAIGIGGALLANYMAKREDPNASIHWSKWIRMGALATSALIVLPGVLGALSVAITFLAGVLSSPAASTSMVNKTAMAMRGSLGATTMQAGAMSGFSSIVSCLVSCGLGILPVSIASMVSPGSSHTNSNDVYVQMLAPAQIRPGQPCTLDFRLVDTHSGKPLGPQQLATMHTKKLHTMVVDSSLTDYHHLHPTYDSVRHVFSCSFTPNLQANYAMWNDFTLSGKANPTQLRTDISVARARAIVPRITPCNTVQSDDLTFRVSTDGMLRQGKPGMLTVDITGPDGRPVNDLEPIMGAYAHLAGFSADGQHFIHSHPMGAEPQSKAERGAGHLQFHIEPGVSGMHRFFLQVERHGQTVTVPFAQSIAPSLSFTERVETEPHSHAGMAMV